MILATCERCGTEYARVNPETPTRWREVFDGTLATPAQVQRLNRAVLRGEDRSGMVVLEEIDGTGGFYARVSEEVAAALAEDRADG